MFRDPNKYNSMDSNYFDGTRNLMIDFILYGKARAPITIQEQEFDLLYKDFKNMAYKNENQVKLMKDFNETKNLKSFEEQYLNIEFFLTESQYNSLMQSVEPRRRFIYSTLSFESQGDKLFFVVGKQSFFASLKETVLNSCVPVDKLPVLERVGIVQPYVTYPVRESVDDGQMKNILNVFLVAQDMDLQAVNVLVVGSSAPHMGGKFVDFLDELFFDSKIECYDINEREEVYVTKRRNVFSRHKRAYVYDRDIGRFDLVIDDAFVTNKGNRDVIDPNRWLKIAKRFTVKYLINDSRYFQGVAKVRSIIQHCCDNCQKGKPCILYKPMYVIRQVARTESMEMRAFSHLPVIGNINDHRFGNCAFCREMMFYNSKEYDDSFFKMLSFFHKEESRCSIKKNYFSNICDGTMRLKTTHKYHFLKSIPLSSQVCMSFDIIDQLEVVHTYSRLSDRVYVFSDEDKVPFFMYSYRIAIKKDGGYYVNFLSNTYQEDIDISKVFYGVPFYEVDKCDYSDLFDVVSNRNDYEEKVCIDYSYFEDKHKHTMIDMVQYYADVCVRSQGKHFKFKRT